MGKSPARWIKTVLFGKKHSKTNASKTATPDKKSGPKKVVENQGGDSPVISDPFQFTDRGVEDVELEKGTSDSPCDANITFRVDQGVDSPDDILQFPVNDVEMKRQEEAATTAQAAFRGYLARRAFRALKGIIRLQALIRGHLVRRQAVATLHCMHAIVKFQALARGRKVRLSDTAANVYKYNTGKLQVDGGARSFFGSEKLAANAFTRKLLVSLPNAMHLSLQYESAEPNSAWNWLERWSLSHFWVPPARTKKISSTKSQRRHGTTQVGESESGKSRRTIRKVSAATNGDNGALPSSESDKPKRNPRKAMSHQTEFLQDQPQNELERVKRSLRKVSSSATAAAASEKPATESEKQTSDPSTKAAPNSTAPEIPEQPLEIPAETPVDSDVVVEKPASPEAPAKIMIDEPFIVQDDDNPVTETHCSENGEKTEDKLNLPDELSSKEEQNGKENPKTRKRRSLPAKQEYAENISQNTPSLPSYMAATESAKAKLRAQGSSKFVEENAELGFVRRHSLPASTNGKLSSLSPRVQKPVQANGKGGNKINRALTTSRDDKALQPGWRR